MSKVRIFCIKKLAPAQNGKQHSVTKDHHMRTPIPKNSMVYDEMAENYTKPKINPNGDQLYIDRNNPEIGTHVYHKKEPFSAGIFYL